MEVQTSNNTSANAEGKNNLDFSKNTKLIERIKIEGTPFWEIITDEGIFIALGQKAITGKIEIEESAKLKGQIHKFDWKMMLGILRIMVEETTAALHLDMMNWNAKVEEGGKNHE